MSQSSGYAQLWNSVSEALAVLDIGGTHGSILFRIIRDSYGWVERGNGSRRCDRVEISLSELAERVGLPVATVRRSVRQLIDRKVLLVHRKPIGRRPGIYGINSKFSEWIGLRSCPVGSTYPLPRRGIKTDPSTEEAENRRGIKTDPSTDTLRDQNGSLMSEARPGGYAAGGPLKERSLKKYPLYPPSEGGVNSFLALPKREQAITAELSVKTATLILEKVYFETFGRSMRKREVRIFRKFLKLSDNIGGLTFLWLQACEKAQADRIRRAEDPEAKRLPAKNPFGDVQRFASDSYQRQKAKGDQTMKTGRANGKINE